MKRTLNLGFNIVLVCLIFGFSNNFVFSQTTRCDVTQFRTCLHSLVDTAFASLSQNVAEVCRDTSTNITADRECVTSFLSECPSQFGQEKSTLLRQYANTLEDVFTTTCDQDFLFSQPDICDLETAVDCLKHFTEVLALGPITTTCRQLDVTLKCVKPSLESCTDRPRYFIARVLDDLQLTHDTICYESGCNLDIAAECVQDANEIYDYPITIVSQSSLVCNKLKSSLACANNHTYTCVPGVIPPGLLANYDQMALFTQAYCGVRANNFMLADIPEDLKSTVVLASLSTNRWASVESICSVYNESLLRAANEGRILTQYTRDLLTWQNAMKLNLDKYGDMCFMQQMTNCDWIQRMTNDQPVCDPAAAERCFDLVLLSKLVVETKVQRSTWQTTCTAMLNMAACSQYHTGACTFNVDLTRVQVVSAKVEGLLGYECSQLGIPDRPETCDEQVNVCDVHGAIKNCGNTGNGTDICREKEEIMKCFKDHTSICNSVQASTAQFYMEWLLGDCGGLNSTLITDDTLKGVASCNLQFGYTIYNGMIATSNFRPLLCSALSDFGACLSGQSTPALATYYLNQYGSDLTQIQFVACNNVANNLPNPPVQEAESCTVDELFGEISLAIQVSSTFPMLSIQEQDEFCSMISTRDKTSISDCSLTRQSVITAGWDYLGVLYSTFCSVTRSDMIKPCDVPSIQMCFENFGGFTYFSNPYSDICGQLEETYNCVYDYAKGCDALDNDIVEEIQIMQSIVGNVTCPEISWCDSIDNTSVAWIQAVCSQGDTTCDLLNWSSCLEESGYAADPSTLTCINNTETKACIARKLSGCDPVQYAIAELQMSNNQPFFCLYAPDPDLVTKQPINEEIRTCYNTIGLLFQSGDLSKNGICQVINQFQQCVGNLNQTAIPSVWQGVLSQGRLMWEKELYLHCQISSSNEFIVDPDFNNFDVFGDACNSVQGTRCLYNMLELLVSYQPFVPLDVRSTDLCQRLTDNKKCVIDQIGGCLLGDTQSLITTSDWVMEAGDNIGTCSETWTEPRICNPDKALQCMIGLGQAVAKIDGMDKDSKIQACSKLQPTTLCVNKQTSGCDYDTRSEIEATFYGIFTITRQICTAPPVNNDNSCINDGEIMTCDVEEALMCFIPVQTLLLRDASFQEVCGSVPTLKTCLHRHTTGCDVHTMSGLDERLHLLSHRMYDQCPYIQCEECKARQCLKNFHQLLQYQDVNLCLAISETKQCISNYAGYCERGVGESLVNEMMLLVGPEGQICDVAIETCLQSLFNSALQIVNYRPQYYYMNQNMSAVQTDAVFATMCQEVSTSYYCVDYHLTAARGTNMTSVGTRNDMTANQAQRLSLMNTTLHSIGDFVGKACQGPRLECYSCVNATSNNECNMHETQSCPLDRQMCGTLIMDNTISKGCVTPASCQSGCMGGACTFCCDGDMCNQPWNSVIQEPETCQPQNALHCGFQLLYSLVQNDTINCRVLQESLSCMSESTRTCLSHDSAALGVYAQHLMSSDIMSSCMNKDQACSCGQCSSIVLLSVITSPYKDVDAFCKTIWRMYNKTVEELDLNTCDIMTLQSTAYNLDVAAHLANGICNVPRHGSNCTYGNSTVHNGASFTAMDGCNTCSCMDGQIGCTLMYCPPSGDYCYYNNQIYEDGDSFKDAEDCNTCNCFNGNVGCTKMYCPPKGGNGTSECDLSDIYNCMSEADLYTKVSKLTTTTSPQLCSSAAGMLKCLDPKISTCSNDVLYVVQGAIMENLNAIQMYCDVYDIINNYRNWNRSENQTKPGPDRPGPGSHGECSIEKGLQCFESKESNDKCKYYQSLIGCVYNHTSSCMSVDALPVTYQLQNILHRYSDGCDLDVPSKPNDPLYPIAHCTMHFANALHEDLSESYLPYQQLKSTCGHLEEYGNCLYSAQLPPLGNFYIMKIENSLSMLVRLCEEYKNPVTNPCAAVSCLKPDCDSPYTPDGQCCPVCPDTGSVKCHNCSMTTDSEGCDSMEPETCQPYQVCGAIMEMEPNTGVTMVSKGCADLSWCQTWMGCDPNTMTCVSCCYGNLCNKALPSPDQTTKRPQITTRNPVSCDLGPISNFMVLQILKLMNHDIMPLRERQYACHNVTSDLDRMLDDLDNRCSPEVKEHVTMTTEWLSDWTSNVCEDLASENKCMEAVQCMENFGNFPDKNTTCRTLDSVQKCLRKHFQYCGAQDKAALNQTAQLLSNMEHVVCVPNKLAADNRRVECVNATEEYKKNHTGMCNVSRVEECLTSLQKASYNPFVTGEEFCRLAKTGMKCVQENTYNCSTMVTQNIAPYVMEVVSYVSGHCPETWCPENSHCKLDRAKECLHQLEVKTRRSMSGDEFDRSVCMEFSKTHDCIMNATYECHQSDTQMITYNFTQLAIHVAPACLYQPPNVTECGQTFLHTVDSLVKYDDMFLANLAHAYSNYQSMMSVMDAMEFFLMDMFPNLLPKNEDLIEGRKNGTLRNPLLDRKRRDAPPKNDSLPQEGFWNDTQTNTSSPAKNSSSSVTKREEGRHTAYLGLNLPYSANGGTNLHDVLSKLEMEPKDLEMLFDASVYREYNQYKSRLCHTAEQSYKCLEQGTRQVFFTGNQEYIMNMSLGLLADVAMEKCHSNMQMCHSCNRLGSNAECDRQAPEACSPFQMCQTKSSHGNITKGCSSVFTCEEECRHSDQPCYCCHGHMCNKRQVSMEGPCEIETAVRCTQDMLRSSLYGDIDKSSGEMHQAAECMMESTQGCHSDTYSKFYKIGEIINTLLESAQCVKSYGSLFCGSSDAVTLAAIVSNPYKTPISIARTCSLFESTLRTFYTKEHEGQKCDNAEEVVRAFQTIYAEIGGYCGPAIVTYTCSMISDSGEKNETIRDRINDRINSSSTGNDVTETGSDVIQTLCTNFEVQSQGVCEVTSALASCFSPLLYVDNPVCNGSNSDYTDVLTCVEDKTTGCVDAELLPIYLMHSIVCGEPWLPEEKLTTSDVIDCLLVIGDLVNVLTQEDDVYGIACRHIQEAEKCLESAHISHIDMMLMQPMFMILEEFKGDVCALDNKTPDYSVTCKEGVESVTCNGSVCAESSCSAYPTAVCVENGCDACQSRFFFRGEEVTQNCTDVISKEECDFSYISKETMIILTMVSSMESLSWTEQTVVCSISPFIDVLKQNASNCPSVYGQPLITLLSWIQGKLVTKCNANTLSNACMVSPSCNVAGATEILGNLGYYLTVASMDDQVFCQKIENTIEAVECSLSECVDEDQTEVDQAFHFMRSIVHTRCPYLINRLYCDLDDSPGNETDGLRPSTRAPATNIPTGRTPPPNIPTGRTQPPNRPTSRAPPANTTGPLRSKRSDDRNPPADGNQEMESRGEGTECPVPVCSYDDAEECLNKCGSVEETNHCLSVSTVGCNPVHKYAIYSILKYTMALQEVPRECWVDVNLQTNESYASGFLQCIHSFTDQVDMSLSGNTTVSPCDLFAPLLECMSTELSSPDIPKVLANNLGHVIITASPSVNLICSHSAVERRKLVKVSEESAECHIDTASRCLNYFSVNTLLNPALSQEAKQWSCKNLDITQDCLHASLKGCTRERRESTLSFYNVVQAMGILSGVCAPKPFNCEPAETLQCISTLAHVVRSHGDGAHQRDVCQAIEHTETCFKQTTSYCDNSTMKMLLKTLEPIRCQAYSVCPMAANKPRMMKPEPTDESACIPVDGQREKGKCNTGSALQCVYKFYSDLDDSMDQSDDATCRLYGETISCFHDNMQGCTDDFTVLMSIMVFNSWKADADTKCPERQGKLFCDLEEEVPDCGLNEVEACFYTLIEVMENGNTNEMCLARREAERCVEHKLSACPYFVKMYGKVNVLSRAEMLKLNTLYGDLTCDGVHQCAYAYTSLFQEVLLAGQNNIGVEVGDVCQTFLFSEDIYPCKARGRDLSCIYSNLGEFPSDVAMVINMTVSQMDTVFSDVCGALLGSQFTSVGPEEARCYLSGVQSYLPLLLSFVDNQRESNISSFSSYEYCSSYADWKANFESFLNSSDCVSSNTTIQFNQWFLSALSQLETTYCTRPCNTSSAEVCLADLKDAIDNNTSDEVCEVYSSVKICIEQAVSSCASDISDQFFTQAETMFTEAQIKCYTMPTTELTFPTSLSTTSPVFDIMEGGVPLQFSVAVSSSVSDSCYTNNCQLEFYVEIDGVPSVSCASGKNLTQFLADKCILNFDDQSTGPETLTFELRIDHRIEFTYNATFSFIARLLEDNIPVRVDLINTATVIVKEEQTAGFCEIVNEPMITTFDGLDYYNFRQGELVMYQHDTLPEKVHIAMQRCSLFSYIPCPCVAMVESGDDVFVVDTCRRFGESFHPIEFKVYKNGDLTPYTKVFASSSKQSYQFVLPSGTIVYVDLADNMLDVSIMPSTLVWGHTSGLCGTYNGDIDDELTEPDGTVTDVTSVPVWSGLPVPVDFTIAWTPSVSLFLGRSADNSLVYLENTRCACTEETCVETELVETCDLVSAEDITSNLGPYLQEVTTSNRRKRQTSNPFAVIDISENSSGTPNNTWPTPSGITEAAATQLCNEAMETSQSWDICRNVVDTLALRNVCLTRILLSDSTNSTASVVKNMVVQCQIAIVTDPTLLDGLNTTLAKLFPYTISCPNNCSNNGNCVDGTCQCIPGYIGDDCSILSTTPPTITSLSESEYSVAQGQGSNSVVVIDIYVYGENFVSSENLTCHTEEVSIQNGTSTPTGVPRMSKATSLTFGQVMCSVSGTLPLTGLLVSVSNNVENQSNSELYIIQDTACFSCDAAAVQCSVQPVSCLIDGRCYGPGVFNPDDGCYLCDPISNVWQYKISTDCPAQTTTTVSTSNAPTTTKVPTATTPPATTTQPQTTMTQPQTTTQTQTTTTQAETTTQRQTTTQPQPTTTDNTAGNTDGQGGNQNADDDDDDDTLTIVIVVAAVLGTLLLMTVIVMAFKLRKSENRRYRKGDRASKMIEDSSSSADSTEQMSGRPNPTFEDAEDPDRFNTRREYSGRTGPFNPQGLSGESAYGRTDDGRNIDVAMFEQQGIPRPQVLYGGQSSRDPNPDYDYTVIKRGDDLTQQARRGDPLYDNAERSSKAAKVTEIDLKDKIAPRIGYSKDNSALRPTYEDDEDSITHL